MTREEFESKRDELNLKNDELQSGKKNRDNAYNEKLNSGNASGVDKFIHGLGNFLTKFIDEGMKHINKL